MKVEFTDRPIYGKQLFTERQAADYLSISGMTLATWRCRRKYNLPFVRIGSSIRYRLSDLEKFLERGLHSGSPEPPKPRKRRAS
jgi:excisionase family DNA binding protein